MLTGQVALWYFRQHPTTLTDGDRTSNRGPILNPRFLEAMMNWPIGWTESGCSETASFQSKPNSRSSISGDLFADLDLWRG